jgi:hypothetical protein
LFSRSLIGEFSVDIGVPYRELANVDISALHTDLQSLSDADWDARPIRKASLAGDSAHCAADSIVLRHEWIPAYSKRGFSRLQESLLDWAARNNRDGGQLLPIMEERNSETNVYTFPDWFRWQQKVLPLIGPVLEPIVRPGGVLTRALFVRLAAGAVIPPHTDGQAVASRAHRIHLCISECPECVYTIGDTEMVMKPGVAYDFNNCWSHAVRNEGPTSRINLMIEYLPDPAWVFPAPVIFGQPGPQATGTG